jgi:uncharacterized protein YjiK
MSRMPSAVVVLALIGGLAARAEEPPTLTPVGEKAIVAIPEASGLAVTKNEYKLWSISDRSFKIYKIKHDGSEKVSFTPQPSKGVKSIKDSEFEGVTFAPKPADAKDDHYLYLVNEGTTAIVPVNYKTETYEKPAELKNMTGWDKVKCTDKKTVKDELKDGGNSGLEGIAWDNDLKSFFVMKEKNPGLMIQISADLKKITACKVLTFSGEDYSDIAYDPTRKQLWVLSDAAQSVYLYDWSSNTARKSYPLGYVKAEGVAYDQEKSRLYIITDSGGTTADLYTYDVAAAPAP